MPKDAKKNTGMEDDEDEEEDEDDDDEEEDDDPQPVAVAPPPGAADKGAQGGGGGGKITLESRFAMMKEIKAAGGAAKPGPAYPKAQWHMY